MLKLKDIKIVESKKELEALPEGKLLINTPVRDNRVSYTI